MALDINYATAEELASLTGIEMDVAQAIIDFRDDKGGFTTLREVEEIPGLDEQVVMRLQEAGVAVAPTAQVDGRGTDTAGM
jgi:competence protein ComEA